MHTKSSEIIKNVVYEDMLSEVTACSLFQSS